MPVTASIPVTASTPCTAFDGPRRIASGPLARVAAVVTVVIEAGAGGPVLVFDDRTGAVIDLDLRGSAEEVVARLAPDPVPEDAPRGRGRPKLGVVAREVTLLPRHWDWLADQPGGASVALRRLVEEARRRDAGPARIRAAQAAAHRFMTAMAGDLPGYEAALRALHAADRAGFDTATTAWPADIAGHARRLAAAALGEGTSEKGQSS